MPNTQDQIAIAFSADIAELQRGTEQASAAVASSIRRMNSDVSGLGSVMKRFAADQRSEARAATFYVNELARIIPVSNDAKAALVGLSGSFMGGFGVVSGITAAVTVAGILVSALQQAEEEAKKLAAEGRKYADALADAVVKRQVLIAGMRGGELAEAQAQADADRATQLKLIRDLEEDIRKKRAHLRDEVSPIDIRRKNYEAEIANLQAQVDKGYVELANITDKGEQKISELVHSHAEKRAGEAEKLTERLHEAVRRAHAKDTSGQATVAGFYALEAEYYDPKAIAQVAEKIADEMKRQLREAHARDTSGEGSVAGFFGLEAATFDPADAARAAQRVQEDYNREVERSVELSQQWGDALGGALGELMTGQATAGQVAASIGRTVLQAMLKSAFAQITANAAVSGSEAAKSQAGIPVVGPALAVAAMGAMMSSVLGLLSKMPSAASGFYRIPFDQPVYTHKDEQILPAAYAEGLRQLVEGGGRGGRGGGITIQVGPNMDSRDVERSLSDSASGVSEALRKIRRQNRGAW